MKVIKEGPGFSIEKKCTGFGNGGGGCGSILGVEIDDIYLTFNTDFSGYTETYYTFRCPICGIETDLKDEEVPAYVKKHARTLSPTNN